jgi:UDP-glucuronate 4-epimerase
VDYPLSLYAASKKANELMAHAYSHLYGLPTTGLRLFTVYGPWGRPDMALFKFTKAILSDKPIQVFNYGKHLRDFTYIDDIVEGVIRVLDKPPTTTHSTLTTNGLPQAAKPQPPYSIYNIGNNKPVELINFIEILEEALEMKADKEMLPLQPGDVPDTSAEVDDLVKQFNYKPSTTVEEGISNFFSWYNDYYKK